MIVMKIKKIEVGEQARLKIISIINIPFLLSGMFDVFLCGIIFNLFFHWTSLICIFVTVNFFYFSRFRKTFEAFALLESELGDSQ